jgi:alkanesulfonate monooxygenase SsuD/methylene tetrahydromethanopterin reductase-like flavin-dependent oxidoreductase (luciferase family)
MRFSISASSIIPRLPPGRREEFVRKVEDYGFSRLWLGDHIVPPDSYNTSFADTMTSLAYLAGVTDELEFGSGVLLLPLYNPRVVARQVANLQLLSDGRFAFGVGLGYLEDDFDAVGVPYEERSERFTESLRIVRSLLHGDEVPTDTRHYDVGKFPITGDFSETPNVIMAGAGIDRNGERVVPKAMKERFQYADGWITPVHSTPETVEADWNNISTYLQDCGKSPTDFENISSDRFHMIAGAGPDEARAEQRRVFSRFMGESRGLDFAESYYTFGSVEEIQETVARFREIGFTEHRLNLATNDVEEAFEQIELWRDNIIDVF